MIHDKSCVLDSYLHLLDHFWNLNVPAQVLIDFFGHDGSESGFTLVEVMESWILAEPKIIPQRIREETKPLLVPVEVDVETKLCGHIRQSGTKRPWDWVRHVSTDASLVVVLDKKKPAAHCVAVYQENFDYVLWDPAVGRTQTLAGYLSKPGYADDHVVLALLCFI